PELRNCIIIVDANGKLIESWTQWDKLFEGGRGPHSVKISPYDPERSVWVVDDMRQQVFKFSNDGKKLLMTLGEAGIAGNDDKHFGRPTDIAWLPDGTFYVTDGYSVPRAQQTAERPRRCATVQLMRVGPSEPACRSRFQTTFGGFVQKTRS